jgi:hypothetical protein
MAKTLHFDFFHLLSWSRFETKALYGTFVELSKFRFLTLAFQLSGHPANIFELEAAELDVGNGRKGCNSHPHTSRPPPPKKNRPFFTLLAS